MLSRAVRVATVVVTTGVLGGIAAATTPEAEVRESLNIGEVVTLESEVLGEPRDLWLYVPPEPHPAGYPAIYLLDGPHQFHHTSGAVDLLGRIGRMPPSIVVGIASPWRSRDFTMTETLDRPSGGAKRFLAFLADEVVPWVENRYPTAPHRTLVGHSLGGLLAFNALASDPGLFDAYLAVSPAVSRDERELADGVIPLTRRLASMLRDAEGPEADVYITMSGAENAVWEEDLARVEGVLAAAGDGIRWVSIDLPDEDHGTSPLASVDRGLQWIWRGWHPEALFTGGDLEAVDRHYAALSDRLGFRVEPPETLVNLVGYRMLRAGDVEDAVRAFEVNVARHPSSANAYDSLGEALETKRALPGALRAYRRAVTLAEQSGHPNLPIFRRNLERVQRELGLDADGGSP